jgi:hypothetical protein
MEIGIEKHCQGRPSLDGPAIEALSLPQNAYQQLSVKIGTRENPLSVQSLRKK